jgi:transposase
MPSKDARTLSADAQEALRMRVIEAIRGGMKPAVAARTFLVSRTAVFYWRRIVAQGNVTSLRSKKRGRPPEPRLAGHQAATIVKLITDRTPDQLKLPFALWTREAVRDLIAQRYAIHVSVRTVGRYLQRWGFTPQKPLRRAYERDPAAVKRWKEQEYPAIEKQAKAEKAEIHWGDQLGARSDHQAGRSYGRRGVTPVIPGTGRRFSVNMMSSITNRGHLCFKMYRGRFNSQRFIAFVRRLLRQRRGRKIFLILDGHSAHCSAESRAWLDAHAARIRVFFLPTYSPDLNPDEYLNNDVKTNAVGRQRPADESQLIANLETYLRDTQRRPNIIKRYFHAEAVRYAAG